MPSKKDLETHYAHLPEDLRGRLHHVHDAFHDRQFGVARSHMDNLITAAQSLRLANRFIDNLRRDVWIFLVGAHGYDLHGHETQPLDHPLD